MNEEGWYHDPYGRHEARWISVGTPTALVRDGDVESQDPPPSTPYDGVLEPVEATAATDGSDLRRADEAEAGSEPYDPSALTDRASVAIDESPGF
jgi:hypothetical protein